MTDDRTIDLEEIDAVEYAASIGHAAAGQLFYVLSGQPKGFRGDWIGCNFSEEEELHQRVYELANYVAERDAGGARLWQKARIDGVIVEDMPESLQFVDAPLPRQWAFDMFATVSLHAYLQVSRTQKEARAAAAIAAQSSQPLKIEDSIFEREGKLDDMEPHSRQFLQDEAAADRVAKEAEAAALEAGQKEPSLSIGGAIEDGAAAPALSVGMQQGQQNAQDIADQGQEAGGEEKPDPDAQGDVSDLADDEPGADGSNEAADDDDRHDDDPVAEAGEVASEMAEQPDEAGGDGVEEPNQPVKPSKAKSPN